MPTFKSFHTGLLIHGDFLRRYPCPPFKGKSWHISFSEYKDKRCLSIQNEVIIHASNQISAQKTLNLILNSLALYSGEPISPFGYPELHVYCNQETAEEQENDIPEVSTKFFGTSGIPVACLIASKASHRKKYIYAIAKYNFSLSLYSQFGVDLEPWSAPHLPVSKHPEDHIAFSHAIISAYSVVEEIGLEVRASSKKQSMIKGCWNPKVKFELEQRLQRAGVDLSDKLLWTMSGTKRKLEKKKELQIFDKMRWSSGPVRDATVEVVDAINYASWLRGYVSSHKVKEITEVISPYDIINVQHLARRLILEPFGIWRDFFKTYKDKAIMKNELRNKT